MQHEELCACQITELIQVSGATASRHLNVLILSGLVNSRKAGRWVYYRLCREKVELRVLINWIELMMKDDPNTLSDKLMLAQITSDEPQEVCR